MLVTAILRRAGIKVNPVRELAPGIKSRARMEKMRPAASRGTFSNGVNGNNPWDITVHDSRFYREVLTRGSLGLGESYMNGWWDCPNLDEFFSRVLSANLDRYSWFNPIELLRYAKRVLFNQASAKHAFVIAKAHYDLGNDLYQGMLDKRLTYTCAYWREGVTTLDAAQEAKLDLVCRKLNLKPGQRVLDIGCGWGSFAKFAAERYKVSVVGITVAREQVELGRQLCQGLPVELRLQDYRGLSGQFDHIVSLGMFEHVEPKNYPEYFRVAAHCLKPGGLFLLHTIGVEKGKSTTDPWIRKYIFPVGTIPSRPEINGGIRNIFQVLDWHDFAGLHYDRTLMAWYENFMKNWPALTNNYALREDGHFKRMWEYYLLSCAGSFRAGKNSVFQIVLAPGMRAYQPVR